MSRESLDEFIQSICDSEALQTTIGEEIDSESLISLGAEHGFEFSAGDLIEHVELSEQELEGVAGGALSVFTNVASMTAESSDGPKFRWIKQGAGTGYLASSKTSE